MEQTVVVFEEVARLADAELIAGLSRCVRADRSLTARLLVHLGEVDARGLFRERACASMFVYAVQELHLSESEAQVRITAARLSRRFPRVIALLAEGAVHLTAIKLLGPHLTEDNHAEVLELARGKCAREIERLVAELAPKPDVPSRMRKLPAPRSTCAGSSQVAAHPAPLFDASLRPEATSPLTATPVSATQSEVAISSAATAASAPQVSVVAGASGHPAREAFQLEPAPRATPSVKPLSPGRYKVECTVGEAMHAKLEQLKALLRHQVPNPDKNLEIILERAVDLLLEKTLKARWAQAPRARTRPTEATSDSARDIGATAEHPRTTSAHGDSARDTGAPAEDRRSNARTHALLEREATARQPRADHADGEGTARPHSRYIPRSVVREVYARDGGQCTFESPEGKRCQERGLLELHHHETPYARGGLSTVENLRTMCRTHNGLLAERDFGRAFMHSKLLHARLRDGANEPVLQRELE